MKAADRTGTRVAAFGPQGELGEREALSRDQKRSMRKHAVRALTVNINRLPKREIELGRALYPVEDNQFARPEKRADCKDGPRPCPFVSCRQNLYLEVNTSNGSIKFNRPDIEPGEMTHSCTLDIADEGGASLERVADVLNIVRERVRQIEDGAAPRLRLGLRLYRESRADEREGSLQLPAFDDAADVCFAHEMPSDR